MSRVAVPKIPNELPARSSRSIANFYLAVAVVHVTVFEGASLKGSHHH